MRVPPIVLLLGAAGLWACASSADVPPEGVDGGVLADTGPGAMRDGAIPGDGGNDAGTSPVPPHDVSQIVLVSDETVRAGARDVHVTFYRNEAYRCGRTGYFTFLVVEDSAVRGTEAPLWVLLHGGAVGYYDDTGAYHPEMLELLNDEEPRDQLAQVLAAGLTDGTRALDTFVTRRALDGHRFLIVSMCDHDLYAGTGGPYPNNPNWPDGDTVDGLLANLAALDFTMRGNGTLAGFLTSRVFLWGGSAGSVGAYTLALALSEIGVVLNGAILDAYVINERQGMLDSCSRLEEIDPEFDRAMVAAKLGPYLADPTRLIDRVIRDGFPVPLLDLVGNGDPWCCGHVSPVPAAAEAGYDNNCEFIHGSVADAVAADGASTLHRAHVVDTDAHTLGYREGPHQDVIEAWYRAALAGGPPPPSWPDRDEP